MFKVDHYSKYKCMTPWVGEKYFSNENKRLLVIGESHYLPESSTVHLNPESWYKNDESYLSKKEISWISTSQIIKNNIDNNFPKKAHGIYKNSAKIINQHTLSYKNPAEILKHYSFYNFFQRPAEINGESIKVSRIDKIISIDVLSSVIETLVPEMVIFTSALAGGYGSEKVASLNIPFIVTPHPTCQWWNRKSKKYGERGWSKIPDFLNRQNWFQ